MATATNFLKSLVTRGKVKGLLFNVYDFLGEAPFLQNKLASVLKGLELVDHLRQDNEVADLFAGRINISQDTILFILNEAMEETEEVKINSFYIEENCMYFTLDIKKGPANFEVLIKLSNLHIILEQNRQKVEIDVVEFPQVIPKSRFLKLFSFIVLFGVRKLVNKQYIYRKLTKGIEGLSVSDNTFSLDLNQVPQAHEVFSRKVLGINIVEFIGVERVEMKEGLIRIYGGPKIPSRLIN